MKKQIDIIEKKLSELLKIMPYQAYLKFIYNNKKIKLYDYVMGRVELGVLPAEWINNLSPSFLNAVEREINNALKYYNL